MSIEIVNLNESSASKKDLEDSAKHLILRLIKESLEDFNLEPWEIALAHNIKKTLENNS